MCTISITKIAFCKKRSPGSYPLYPCKVLFFALLKILKIAKNVVSKVLL